MIAERFRSLWWAAFALLAGLTSYMANQHVAGHRRALEKVEARIHAERLAVRALETELGTRASLSQLERWNAETLALRAPRPEQYVAGAAALASLSTPRVAPPASAVAAAAAVAQVAYRPAPAPDAVPAAAPTVTLAARPAPIAAPPVTQVAFRPARATPARDDDAPVLRAATYVRPARDRASEAPRKVAMLTGREPLSAGTLADLGRIAARERSRSDVGGQ